MPSIGTQFQSVVDWVAVGHAVAVTYTPGAGGMPVARQITAASPPST
jgi:hypothetical protein